MKVEIDAVLTKVIRDLGLSTVETFSTPARSARNDTLPDAPQNAKILETLRAMDVAPDALWLHQVAGFAAIAEGRNVVLATGTGSGKTLIFQAAIIAGLREDSSTHLVFYPQKALAADQLHRWQSALEKVGLPPEWAAEVNGDVPTHRREQAAAEARILLATPDVIHAWMMRHLDDPKIQHFLARLKFVVIDEAHSLEGPFGSSVAFLLRRLLLARSGLTDAPPVRFIAATATIANPQQHLEALTGERFLVIDEMQNGAPKTDRVLFHVRSAPQIRAMEAQAASLAKALPSILGENAFIIFVDSRQGVERITRLVGDPSILPYRSGYEAEDRRRIEQALRQRRLSGVIATSALELGIDIPQFVLGINLGLPTSRKAFHQRLGRIGRAKSSAFIVMAPESTFSSLGTSFSDYYCEDVEQSHLYLENRFIQYAQARCLLEECRKVDIENGLPGQWPMGFELSVKAARPGGRRSADLDLLASVGGDNPHINYPLRQIASDSIELRLAGTHGDRIGTIATHQAIREAYPGATYYHLQRPFKVAEWRLTSYERSIRLRAVREAEPTHPILRQWVNGSFEPAELLEGRLWKAPTGNCAEAMIQVLEAVEGIRTEGGAKLYSDLSSANPRLRRQQRDFPTTGILLQIAEPWFAGANAEQYAIRKAIAAALAQLLCRELSIAPAELSWTHTNIALCAAQGPRKTDDTIAIYDNIRGGLRLTSQLPELLPTFASRLQLASGVAGDEALIDASTEDRFAKWVKSLKPVTALAAKSIEVPPGELLIYSPGSEVTIRASGQLLERRIIEPAILAMPDGEHLFYRYELDQGINGWVAHDAVEPLGQAWQRAFWNPVTKEVRSIT